MPFLLGQRMTVLFSPWANNQFLTANSVLASGWKIYSYAAGSSTPQTTYTTSAGDVAQSNPIVLDSLGFPTTGQIWLTSGLSYKLVLTDENGVVKKTEDNITGVTGTASVSQWQASGLTPTYVSATSFTLVGDQTNDFHVGRRLQSTTTAGTVYSTISATAYTTLTTVTVINDGSGVMDSGLSQVNLGLITAINTSLPRIGPTIQVFTATGTYTRPTGVRRIRVRVVGGGGAGGATSGANQGGGGGGGGGYSEELIDASAITTVSVTIGAGGTSAGTTAGGTTSFGAYLQATGGGSGVGGSGTAGAADGGAGGIGSGGDVNAAGGAGGNNYNNVCGGTGGDSALGGGGKATHNGGAGTAGRAYGGGGSGGGDNGGVAAGGSGAAGVVIVEEFY